MEAFGIIINKACLASSSVATAANRVFICEVILVRISWRKLSKSDGEEYLKRSSKYSTATSPSPCTSSVIHWPSSFCNPMILCLDLFVFSVHGKILYLNPMHNATYSYPPHLFMLTGVSLIPPEWLLGSCYSQFEILPMPFVVHLSFLFHVGDFLYLTISCLQLSILTQNLDLIVQ